VPRLPGLGHRSTPELPALLARIAAKTGAGVVRSIRVLAPGAPAFVTGTTGARTVAAEGTAAAETPCEPSAGYQRAVAACRASKPDRRPAPAIREAVERQNRALADHREPEGAFREVLTYEEGLREKTVRRRSDEAHRLALRRAREEMRRVEPADHHRQLRGCGRLGGRQRSRVMNDVLHTVAGAVR